jgi:hypothetical protein
MNQTPTTAPNPITPKRMILITTLAEYQTKFWALVGKQLISRSIPVAFLSFDDRSTSMLRSMGFTTFALQSEDRSKDFSDSAFDLVLKRFEIEDFPYWSSHELFTFGISERELRQKFLEYLSMSERAYRDLKNSGYKPVIVQELGGFLSVIASYFAGRQLGFDNWFIEPSFFRGRLFFLKNQFKSLEIAELVDSETASVEVIEYLTSSVENGLIVVPKKDAHQYTSAVRKIFHRKNMIRLLQKLFDKYMLGKRQEFQYIRRHVLTHCKMLISSIRLHKHYTPLKKIGHFIYYPLHVPGDMALTLRSPQYLDQLALIDYLMRSVPHDYKVAIKEHPAMIGAVDAGSLIRLKKRYKNLVILPPDTNNYLVIKASDLVVSINSKSGAEAVLLGKSVLVLGDAFYRNSPLVHAVESLASLRSLIRSALDRAHSMPANREADLYFEAVWRASYPGELYVDDGESLTLFVDSMVRVVLES